MTPCVVEITGRDGQAHSMTIEASSVFDAAYQALQAWSLMWWHDPNIDVTVRTADRRWRVKQSSVREWHQNRSKTQPSASTPRPHSRQV